jgi:hypothetical protein
LWTGRGILRFPGLALGGTTHSEVLYWHAIFLF